MGDIFDEIAGNTEAAPSAAYGDIFDEIAGNVPEPSLLERPWIGIKKAPGILLDTIKAVPEGVGNLNYLSGKIMGAPEFSGGTDYGRLERTARGVGGLASGVAGAGVGAMAGAPLAPFTLGLSVPIGAAVGGAAGLLGFNKLNQLTGADEQTSPNEDLGQFLEDTGTFGVLGAVGEVVKGGAKVTSRVAPKIAENIDRKSLGTRQSDYGKASETRTVETPEGMPETFLKSSLDDLLNRGELGTSRNPAELLKTIDSKANALAKQVAGAIKTFDESGAGPATPNFSGAIEYLKSGQVPADLIDNYAARLGKLEQSIMETGQGKLEFLQKQKQAFGKSYDPADKVLSGFNRAIYSDLKNTIEGYVPEVGPLNAELAKFIVTEPIVNRALKASENKSPLSTARDLLYTTGGIGAPTIVGSVLGGPAGAAVGAGIGLTGRALASPAGQALIARGLRSTGKAAGAIESVFGNSGGTPLKSKNSTIAEIFEKNQAADLATSSGESLRPSQVTSASEAGSPLGPRASSFPDEPRNTSNTSPSSKYLPTTSATDILADSGFISHYNNTISEAPALQKLLKKIGGNRPIKSDTKDASVAANKILRKVKGTNSNYSESDLGDLIRGRITAKDSKDAQGVIAKLKATGQVIGEVQNQLDTPSIWGYRGANANIAMKNGAIGEVQIHTPESLVVKKAIRPIYDKYRHTINDLPFEEQLKIYEQSRKVADKAARDFRERTGRPSGISTMFGNKAGPENQKEKERSAISYIFEKGNVSMDTSDIKPIAAIEQEIDSDPYFSALYEAESGRDPKAKNPESSAAGGFQFVKATAKAVGLDDPFDLEKSFKAVKKLTDEHRDLFGDNPEDLYAAHYLGSRVLKKLIERKPLTEAEQAQVNFLQTKALPRFMNIYNRITKPESFEV